MKHITLCFLLFLGSLPVMAQLDDNLAADIDAIEDKVIEWRHHFHEFPELSNREFNTGKKIAEHLKS